MLHVVCRHTNLVELLTRMSICVTELDYESKTESKRMNSTKPYLISIMSFILIFIFHTRKHTHSHSFDK